jgi:hypothetical protein
MKGNASLLFGQFHHSNVIFMVAHHFGYKSPTFEIPNGIRLSHNKIPKMGPYFTKI